MQTVVEAATLTDTTSNEEQDMSDTTEQVTATLEATREWAAANGFAEMADADKALQGLEGCDVFVDANENEIMFDGEGNIGATRGDTGDCDDWWPVMGPVDIASALAEFFGAR